jgi:hypothetical protein
MEQKILNRSVTRIKKSKLVETPKVLITLLNDFLVFTWSELLYKTRIQIINENTNLIVYDKELKKEIFHAIHVSLLKGNKCNKCRIMIFEDKDLIKCETIIIKYK